MEGNEFPEQPTDKAWYGARVIEFIGGPLDGELHEVEAGWPCPSQIGHPITGGGMAVYDVDRSTDVAEFKEVEL